MAVTWSAFSSLHDAERAAALGAALERLTPPPSAVGVVEVEEDSGLWEVAGYFTEPPDRAGLALLAVAHGGSDFLVSEVPETDWVAQVRRELVPVEAGRFFVYGAHDAERLPPGRIGLLIEAAMAFGTGHHATTQACLLALDALAGDGFRPQRVADIGAGTAVLAMAAQRLWPEAQVLAADIDAVAVEVAQANVSANGLTQIACIESAGLAHPRLAAGGFDLILANILQAPLLEMAGPLCAALNARDVNAGGVNAGGVAVLSGLLLRQCAAVEAAYGAQGMELQRRHERGDWAALVLRRKGQG